MFCGGRNGKNNFLHPIMSLASFETNKVSDIWPSKLTILFITDRLPLFAQYLRKMLILLYKIVPIIKEVTHIFEDVKLTITASLYF